MDSEILIRARGALERVTPMNPDCGLYCGAACCRPDDEGKGGVILFPGEEALIDPAIAVSDVTYGSWRVKVADCAGSCRREGRPLGCMIFPLTPEFDPSGELVVRFDVRARPVCPLLRNGLMGLRRDFRAAVHEALALIASDPEGKTFLEAWQALEKEYMFSL